MVDNSRISDIIQGLEQIKDIHGNKEVCILRLISEDTEQSLFVEFMDYSTHTIEIKTEN